jgi:hypothetical protein
MADLEQSANAVLMIRPHRFYPNPETAADNAFQQAVAAGELPRVSAEAQAEFDRAVETLRECGRARFTWWTTPLRLKNRMPFSRTTGFRRITMGASRSIRCIRRRVGWSGGTM